MSTRFLSGCWLCRNIGWRVSCKAGGCVSCSESLTSVKIKAKKEDVILSGSKDLEARLSTDIAFVELPAET